MERLHRDVLEHRVSALGGFTEVFENLLHSLEELRRETQARLPEQEGRSEQQLNGSKVQYSFWLAILLGVFYVISKDLYSDMSRINQSKISCYIYLVGLECGERPSCSRCRHLLSYR